MSHRTISLDIGGTRIKMAAVSDGKIEKITSIPAYSEGNLRDRLPAVEEALGRLVDHDFSGYEGMGVALPCLVDAERGVATEIHHKFEDVVTMNLPEWVRKTFGMPCVIEQDSKAALLGEVHYGCAQGCEDVLMVIMGTGIGTAVMLDGRLLDGKNHCSGSLGCHIIIEKNGRPCICGNRGCLEAYTSGWALPHLLREHAGFEKSAMAQAPSLDFYHLGLEARRGDRVAQEVLSGVIDSLRVGLISLIHAFGPSAVVLSGGPINMGEQFTGPLLDGIQKELWGINRNIRFMEAEKPDGSVLLGLHYISLKASGAI